MFWGRALVWNIIILIIVLVPVSALALVDINTADSEELQTLTGIGSSKAQSIIDYRNTQGFFEKKEDIKNVSGIGDATYENIKNDITVGVPVEEEGEDIEEVEEEEVGQEDSSGGSSGSSEVPAEIFVSSKKVVVGMPVRFEGYEGIIDSLGGYSWNFGDGRTGRGPVIHHVYKQPGSYVVSLNYTGKGYDHSDRITLVVLEAGLKISSVKRGPRGFVEIRNDSEVSVDVSNWQLKNSIDRFIFPNGSYVAPESSLRIDVETLSLVDMTHLDLVDIEGNIVASYPGKVEKIPKSFYRNNTQDVSVYKDEEPKEPDNLAAVSRSVSESDDNGQLVWFGALLAIITVASGLLFWTSPKVKTPEDDIKVLDE